MDGSQLLTEPDQFIKIKIRRWIGRQAWRKERRVSVKMP